MSGGEYSFIYCSKCGFVTYDQALSGEQKEPPRKCTADEDNHE